MAAGGYREIVTLMPQLSDKAFSVIVPLSVSLLKAICMNDAVKYIKSPGSGQRSGIVEGHNNLRVHDNVRSQQPAFPTMR